MHRANWAYRAEKFLQAVLLMALSATPPWAGAAEPARPSAEAARPDWIWAAERKPGQSMRFRRDLVIEQEIVQAQLAAVADFCRMTLFVNGQPAANVAAFEPPLETRVTRLLRQGANTLSVEAVATDGPAAIAAELVLVFADGAQQRVWTDTSWQPVEATAEAPLRRTGSAAGRPASFGLVDLELWPAGDGGTRITEVDDYTQWTQALGAERSTDPSTFLVPPGFEIELLRSAQPGEGSWVSLEFDPQGRLLIAKEDRGLLRMTLPSRGMGMPPPGAPREAGSDGTIVVETVDDELQECRGLLWAHDSLYVNANNSKGLYRLRDTDGDDRFDRRDLLYASTGGVGHGRNDLALGPDGKIYAIHGDAVDLPRSAAEGARSGNGSSTTEFADLTSPLREHRQGQRTREGYLLRFDADGGSGEIVAAGLRNPYGIDFHPDGEPFTYDADAEFDMGSPWYRPTRVDHLVSGADFGWRGVTGSWPPYYPDHPDNAPPNVDIGKGSPTGVKFGARSQFPPPYRQALFILDWAYGRIVAVHLSPRGASYLGHAETFVKGRPLNVTDLGFGPDGAMYVVTGGRKTQSGLYRIRYIGPPVAEAKPTPQQAARATHAVQARQLRRKLESYHGRQDSQVIAAAWPWLDSSDPWLRHAARIAVEHQAVDLWQQRALSEPRPLAAVTALLALARVPATSGNGSERRRAVVARLNELPLEEMTLQEKISALYAYQLGLADPGALPPELHRQAVKQLEGQFPQGQPAVDQALSRLLIDSASFEAVPKTLELLAGAAGQRERMHYLFVLRGAKAGWTSESRRAYFLALRTMRDFQGGEGMPKFIRQIEADALAALPAADRPELAALLADARDTNDPLPAQTRPLVRAWKLEDLVGRLPEVGRGRSFERGKAMFSAALCVRCHRVATLGGAIGPDLTALSGRFSRRDVLDSILNPSKVVAEQYRLHQIATVDGRQLSGQIVPSSDFRSPKLRIATDPLRPERITELAKSDIESHTVAELSAMPSGLLDTLTSDEILDLMAFLESAGDLRHPNFRH
jgi:putative heme-binding domain-containing protein